MSQVPPPAGLNPDPPGRRAALLSELLTERFSAPVQHKGRRPPPEPLQPDDPEVTRRRRIVLHDISYRRLR